MVDEAVNAVESPTSNWGVPTIGLDPSADGGVMVVHPHGLNSEQRQYTTNVQLDIMKLVSRNPLSRPRRA